jgi:hypothetical protein
MSESAPVVRCRTAFISDIHLGTKGCQAALLLEFIRELECETLYLVGDIVDGWKMKSGWFWPQAHNDVVQKILRLARKGVQVVYIPGNHDDRIRDFCGVHFGGVVVARDAIHEAADGRRYLVTHGDEFDAVVQHAKMARLPGRLELPRADRSQHPLQPRTSRPRPGLLEPLGVPEAPGEGRGEVHRPVRGGNGRRGAPARRPGRDLRPHPSRRDA